MLSIHRIFFLVKVGSEARTGTNYYGYYVCEFIGAYTKRTLEEILKVCYINIFIYSQFLLLLIYISNHVTNTHIYILLLFL